MKSLEGHFWFGPAAIWLLAGLWAGVPATAVADDATQPAVGAAQTAPDKPAPAAEASFPAQPPPVQRRGFLNDVGTWWDRSFSDFAATMKAARDKLEDFNKTPSDAAQDAATATKDALSNAAQATKDAAAATKQAMDNAAEATKDAATAVVRLPGTRVLELNDRCAVAANGAPDCGATASSVCRQKGFNSGRVIDIRTSQECPAEVRLSGRTPAEGECPDATFVLRAVCQ